MNQYPSSQIKQKFGEELNYSDYRIWVTNAFIRNISCKIVKIFLTQKLQFVELEEIKQKGKLT